MSSVPINHPVRAIEWHLPSKRRVGMSALIVGESAIFTIFVVAYVFYMGKSLTGPTPQQVLEVPILSTICLLSSSLTIWRAEKAIEEELIYQDGLTISTNLFGTTFYSLVGLHATHVVVGLFLLTTTFVLSLFGWVDSRQSERFGVIALYWHFVDGVWIVVFTVVYLIGR
jgi:cytochrome c oxidase subunit 3/cytochrome o ubiquinol oxidase subunit 3